MLYDERGARPGRALEPARGAPHATRSASSPRVRAARGRLLQRGADAEHARVRELLPQVAQERRDRELLPGHPVAAARRGGSLRPWACTRSRSHVAQRAEVAALELRVDARAGRRAASPTAAPPSGCRACRSGSSRSARRPSGRPAARPGRRRARRARAAGACPRSTRAAGRRPRALPSISASSSSKRRTMWRL